MSSFAVEGLEAHTPTNHYNYNDEEMLEKRDWMEKLIRIYPTVSPLHIEWIYDICKRTPPDELEEMKKRIDESSPVPAKLNSRA